MPRQARLDISGALHHIMVRGINKSAIFKDRQDRNNFLDRLGQNIITGKCSVYAWVLMKNHVHILFKSGQAGISEVMRKLLTWYAQYFNHRHNRTGHLFENRYKSILCDEENYFLALVRYIHLNPIRAKIISSLAELDRYPWSGHAALMGCSKIKWMDTASVLARFGDKIKSARRAYRLFVEDGIDIGSNPELIGGGLIRSKGGWSQVLSARRKSEKEEFDERILGDGDFVNAILRETEEKMRHQLKSRKMGRTLNKIIAEECQKGKISVKELQNGGRRKQVSEIRAKVSIRGQEELGLTMAEIARQTGVNTSSIARALERKREKAS
ncbi:transposase [bacterium]|nr:transposase [bacterium]